MKKLLLLIIMCILLSGCANNKEVVTTSNYKFNNSYYSVYTPYKKGIAGNYIVNKIDNNLDIEEVETGLMRVALKYFDNNRYYLQEGQYLSKKDIQKLLANDYLNKTTINNVGGSNIKPTIISYIVEHDYLNIDGKLSGIVIGIVLNPYQLVTGTNNYVKIDDKVLYDFASDKASELIYYLRDEKKLKGTDIAVGLYYQANSDTFLPGSYQYSGFTAGDDINNFEEVNEQYYLFPSSSLKDIDSKSYTAFTTLVSKAQNIISDASIIGKGLYGDKMLQKLDIDVTLPYYNKDSLIAVSEVIAASVSNFNAFVNVEIKQMDETKVLIIKDKNKKANIYFLD